MSSLKEACSPPTGVSVGRPGGREGSVRSESLRLVFPVEALQWPPGRGRERSKDGRSADVLSWPHEDWS